MPSSRATSTNEPIPFSREDAWSFYLSLLRRYRARFLGLAFFMLLFAGLVACRLVAVGVILDAVRIHLEAQGRSEGEVPDDTAVESFNSFWRTVFPDSIPSPTDPENLQSADGFENFLIVFVLCFAVLSIALGIFLFVKESIAISTVVRMLIDTRKALFDHLTRQSVAYFHGQRAGDLISRVTNDVETVQSALHAAFQTLLQQPPLILSGLLVAFLASPFLFAVAMPILAIMVVPVLRAGRKVIHHGRRRQQRLGVITEALQQLFGGIRIVKAFGMERHERETFESKNRAFGHSFRKTLQAQVAGRSVQEILYNLGLAGLLLLGGWLLTSGTGLSLGEFSMFVLAMVQIYSPLKTASKAWNKVQESRAGVERVLDILRREPSLKDREDAREFPGIHESVRFDNVSFSYRALPDAILHASLDSPLHGEQKNNGSDSPRPPPAVDGIEFEVEKGQLIALVGPSGSGKSTVVDLLARFYEPQKGAILIDGVDIREYRHASYLDHIAIVSQDPFLFNTTIRENILYGKEGASDEEIHEAAKAANAHDFILAQPRGYETEIGERGAKLSGGQRQRLTIARALLKNAPILILDEATSALDSEAEREVQKAIDNLVRERTTFVVAHRLSTVRGVDKIIVLDRGRIVEQGTHEDLMRKRGRYHTLYRAQNPLVEAGTER